MGALLAACGASDDPVTSTDVATSEGASATVQPRTDRARRATTCSIRRGGMHAHPRADGGSLDFDVDAVRSDIREDREGPDLRVAIRVQDAAVCDADRERRGGHLALRRRPASSGSSRLTRRAAPPNEPFAMISASAVGRDRDEQDAVPLASVRIARRNGLAFQCATPESRSGCQDLRRRTRRLPTPLVHGAHDLITGPLSTAPRTGQRWTYVRDHGVMSAATSLGGSARAGPSAADAGLSTPPVDDRDIGADVRPRDR